MSNTPLWFRRLLVGGVSALTVGGLGLVGLASTAGPASATSNFTINQLAGPNRFATAAAIAKAAFPHGAKTVVIASGLDGNLSDSLAASYLASQLNGGAGAPILLVNAASVPSDTSSALSALGATSIVIVGGTSAVSTTVATDLTNGGTVTVTRVAGSSRFLTADAIDSQTGMTKVGTAGGKKYAIIADGQNQNLVDALGASPLANAGPFPLLLVNGPTGTLSSADQAILTNDGITNVILVGGSAAIGSALTTQLTNLHVAFVQKAGPDRSATSAALANYEIANFGFSNSTFDIAGGAQPNLVDSLSGGPYGGMHKAPTLITDSPTNAASVATFATAHSATESTATLFGGSAGVSAATEAAIIAAAKATPSATTSLPTLVGASILGTAVAGNNTGAPLGTTVQYVFSQPMTGDALVPADFHVYSSSDTRYSGAAGNAKVDATNANAVDVFYPDTALQTTAGAATLTLATVQSGAVTSVSTGTNPDGSEPIGSAATSTLSAGVTTAPDLLTAVATGSANTTLFPNMTAVNLTFNKPAYVTATGGVLGTATTGFSLVLTDGTSSFCTPPTVGSTTAGGGIVPGGNGTTTLTVVCTNDATSATTALTTSMIARAIDGADSVSTAATGGITNQAEATSSPNTAVSTNPDLTGVTLNLKVGASGATDSIVYTFNGPVTIPTTAAGFNAITSAAGLVTNGTVDTANSTSTSIVIDYTDPALANVVAGSVTAGTVTSTNVAKATNLFNELGVANSSSSSVTPGIVDAPQLTGAAIASFTNSAGTSVDGIQYTFSQPIVTTGAILTGAGLHAYDANGTQLNCIAATATGSTALCTSFVTTATTPVAATQTQISTASLGTADYNSVTGTTAPYTNPNPEGAAS